jgi:hypothetical protein
MFCPSTSLPIHHHRDQGLDSVVTGGQGPGSAAFRVQENTEHKQITIIAGKKRKVLMENDLSCYYKCMRDWLKTY